MRVKSVRFIYKIIFIIAILISSNIYAQGDDFILRGQVLSTCFVQIAEEPVASNLDLIGAGHTGTTVANVQVFSNSSALASVSGISDDTGGLLVNQSDPTHTIPYTLNYSSTDTGTTHNNINVPNGTPFVLDFQIGPGNYSGNIGINITPDPTLEDGSYEANVTVACTII